MRIVYACENLFISFHEALDSIAKEEIFIEMIAAQSLEEVSAFQKKLITNNWPAYYAVSEDTVVGWININMSSNPRMAHRGFLSMGLIKSYRGQGLGSQLTEKALSHAKSLGLEKIELSVFSENTDAIKLYKKFGFKEVGCIKKFRKLL